MYLIPRKFTQRKKTKGHNRLGKKKIKAFRCLLCQEPLPLINALLADGKVLKMADLVCRNCQK